MGVSVSKSRLVNIIVVLCLLSVTFTDIINNCVEKDKNSFWSGCNEFALSVGCNEFLAPWCYNDDNIIL